MCLFVCVCARDTPPCAMLLIPVLAEIRSLILQLWGLQSVITLNLPQPPPHRTISPYGTLGWTLHVKAYVFGVNVGRYSRCGVGRHDKIHLHKQTNCTLSLLTFRKSLGGVTRRAIFAVVVHLSVWCAVLPVFILCICSFKIF